MIPQETIKVSRTSNLSFNQLEFDKDIPFVKKGISLEQIWFCGGRTSATILKHGGIGQILYFGRQAMPFHQFFQSTSPQSSWEKLFRLSVIIGGVSHYPEFNNTRIYPFGYTSECAIAGVKFQHSIVVLNDAIVQRVKVLSNPARKKLSLRVSFHGHNGTKSNNRKWGSWQVDDSLGFAKTFAIDAYTEEECRQQIEHKKREIRDNFLVSDVPYAETHIALASNLHASLISCNKGFKYYLNTADFKDEATTFLVFNPEAKGLENRVKELRKSFASECDKALSTFKHCIETSPKINVHGHKTTQSLLANIPPVINAVEARDIPGGFRAAMHGYWIWMDLFCDSNAFTYANDAESLRDMLLLFQKFTDDKLGIPALVTTEMKPFLGAAVHTQCMYIVALYHYYCFTGDRATLKKCYPFISWLIRKGMEKEVQDTGLIEGVGLPDFPADQDGHDICSSGNSLFYQSLRIMESLSRELHTAEADEKIRELANTCAEMAARCRESFDKYFFDPEKGFYVDSLSSRNFSKRPHYPAFAIQWTTPFAVELVKKERVKPVAKFLSENFTRTHGIGGMIPTWDSAYPGDGNQLLAYYPSWMEGFYRNTMKLAGRERELVKWFDDVEWFWQQNTIPEGHTYDAENEEFSVDNPGTKQAFAGQAWYCVFFRCIIGIQADTEGLILSPSTLRKKITVKDFTIRGKKIDITVTGKGFKGTLTFNGKKLKGQTIRIPFTELKARNTLVI